VYTWTKGSGKSVLASSVYNDLLAKSHRAIFFSFHAAHGNQRKLARSLSSLLWQLLQKAADQEAWTAAKNLLDFPPNVGKLLGAIKRVFGILQPKTHYLIVDAIDECEDEWNSSDQGGLSIIKDLMATTQHLHVLLVGRKACSIAAMAGTVPSLELTEDLLYADVAMLIDEEMKNSPNIQPLEIRELVKRTLSQNSSTMFLWVSLVFKNLRHLSSPSQLRSALNNMPAELEDAYENLLNRLSEQICGNPGRPSLPMQMVRDLLAILISASGPLTIDQLRHAYGAHACRGPEMLIADHFITRDIIILSTCGDFIRVSEGVVHLSHITVREFFTRPENQWRSMAGDAHKLSYRVDISDGQMQWQPHASSIWSSSILAILSLMTRSTSSVNGTLSSCTRPPS